MLFRTVPCVRYRLLGNFICGSLEISFCFLRLWFSFSLVGSCVTCSLRLIGTSTCGEAVQVRWESVLNIPSVFRFLPFGNVH